MSISKRSLVIGAAGFAASMSTAAIAQTKAKSKSVTQLGDGDAVWINPKTGDVQKSNTKVSAAKHQAVRAGGGKEIPRGAVIYNQSGKMYMFDPGAAGNEAASANFQDSFNDWANQ
jgi:hypothetical protein